MWKIGKVSNYIIFSSRNPKSNLNFEIFSSFRVLFQKGEIDVIPSNHIYNQWLYVLPNMTRAKVRSISRHVVTSKLIQNQQDMKWYWDSLYGYVLPETFGQVYVNVTFGVNSGTFANDLFCYPIEVTTKNITESADFLNCSFSVFV